MAAENFQNILFNTGRLIKAPTNLSTDYPYGGTELGYTRDAVLIPSHMKVLLTAEEWGQVVVEGVETGRVWALGVTVRGWDSDAWRTIFPGVALGPNSNKYGINDTLTNVRAGTLSSDRAVSLLFVPDDTERHPGVYIPRALPFIAEDATPALALAEEFVVNASFVAIPDGSNRIIQANLLSDITL